MNKLFAFILFFIGIALILAAACANPVVDYMTPGANLLDAWGIIWRIGLGLILLVIAVLLNNMESFGGGKSNDF